MFIIEANVLCKKKLPTIETIGDNLFAVDLENQRYWEGSFVKHTDTCINEANVGNVRATYVSSKKYLYFVDISFFFLLDCVFYLSSRVETLEIEELRLEGREDNEPTWNVSALGSFGIAVKDGWFVRLLPMLSFSNARVSFEA